MHAEPVPSSLICDLASLLVYFKLNPLKEKAFIPVSFFIHIELVCNVAYNRVSCQRNLTNLIAHFQ